MARRNLVLLAAALLLGFPLAAAAQSYPNGPIKILTGFPPGGTADILAREVGNELEKAWRTPVIVETVQGPIAQSRRRSSPSCRRTDRR
jgi:tripartite-type tricarboxylate transporter receptor subunit TctC